MMPFVPAPNICRCYLQVLTLGTLEQEHVQVLQLGVVCPLCAFDICMVSTIIDTHTPHEDIIIHNMLSYCTWFF